MSLHNAFSDVQSSVEALNWQCMVDITKESTDELVNICVLEGLQSLADDFPDKHFTKSVISQLVHNTTEAIERNALIVESEASNPSDIITGSYIRASGDQIAVGLIASHEWLNQALSTVNTRMNVRALASLIGAASVADYFLSPDLYEEALYLHTLTAPSGTEAEMLKHSKAVSSSIYSRAGFLDRNVMVAGMVGATKELD